MEPYLKKPIGANFLFRGIPLTVRNYDPYLFNKDYIAILELAALCEIASFPYRLDRCFDGCLLTLFDEKGKRIADIMESKTSYGHESDLVESIGLPGDNICGGRTIEEVFAEIKALY